MFHKFASIINTDSGSISFTVGNHNLFEETVKPITIDSVQVNGTEFLLQRDPDMKLVLYDRYLVWAIYLVYAKYLLN
jgi:hypothetical protein